MKIVINYYYHKKAVHTDYTLYSQQVIHNTMPRGIIVQAPICSGKTQWLDNLPLNKRSQWIEGSELLAKEGLNDLHNLWYDNTKTVERNNIQNAFDKYLSQGINILYSGNPALVKGDVIVWPESETRWKRLSERKKLGLWIPTKLEFDQEEYAYSKAAKQGNATMVVKEMTDVPY